MLKTLSEITDPDEKQKWIENAKEADGFERLRKHFQKLGGRLEDCEKHVFVAPDNGTHRTARLETHDFSRRREAV